MAHKQNENKCAKNKLLRSLESAGLTKSCVAGFLNWRAQSNEKKKSEGLRECLGNHFVFKGLTG